MLTLDSKRQHGECRPDQHERDGAIDEIGQAEQRNPGDEVQRRFLFTAVNEVAEPDRAEKHGKKEKSRVHGGQERRATCTIRSGAGVMCSALIVSSKSGNLLSCEYRKIVLNRFPVGFVLNIDVPFGTQWQF